MSRTLRVAAQRASAREPCATFAPIHYEPGYAYPLIVWLHSTASCERELRHVMPLVSMRNYVAIAPRALSPSSGHRNKYSWRQTGDDIEAAETRVADCIAAASRRYQHSSVEGLPGRMWQRWHDGTSPGVERSGRFAGVVAINGPLPTRWQPLRRVNEARRVPCLLAASRENRAYPDQANVQRLATASRGRLHRCPPPVPRCRRPDQQHARRHEPLAHGNRVRRRTT